jgi:selenocysteine lyase/cysteine desulfurase
MVSPPAPRIDQIRAQFPSLECGFAYLENAGGSQVPRMVADAMRDYMLSCYVQLGAGYPASRQATETVARAHDAVNLMFNGEGIGKTILGPSSTQLLYMLADCYARALSPGDEIIVAETGHEANVGPWARLADRGFVIKIWKVDPESQPCRLEDLQALLAERTKLVAFPMFPTCLAGSSTCER